MFVLFAFVLFAMIVATVNAVYAFLDENYCTLRNWGIIIFTSLFTIIIWVFFLV